MSMKRCDACGQLRESVLPKTNRAGFPMTVWLCAECQDDEHFAPSGLTGVPPLEVRER